MKDLLFSGNYIFTALRCEITFGAKTKGREEDGGKNEKCKINEFEKLNFSNTKKS